MDYKLGYREIIPDQSLPDKWKEIIISTGGSQSTLQDIKVSERAGGYCYKPSSRYFTQNRFIYWRIAHDVLELVEYSLDINLVNNQVRYKFTDTPILEGITIHETANSIVILVVTVSSVHKLSFVHPKRVHKQDQTLVSTAELTMQSIFSEATVQAARDPSTLYVIPNVGLTNSPVAHAAASWLTMPQEEAQFALAYDTGLILLLRMDTVTGLVHSSELKHESIMPRFLSGLATAFRRNNDQEIPMSLVIHSHGSEVYLFALYQEGTLRMWSCNKTQCIAVINVSMNNQNVVKNIQNHALKKVSGTKSDELYLTTYLKYDSSSEFCVLKVVQEAGSFKLNRMCTLLAPDHHLVDFSFTTQKLWAVWRTIEIDSIAITHVQLPLHNNQISCEWESAELVQPPDKDYIISEAYMDPRETYINYIFHPGKFALADIIRALSIYRKTNFLIDINLSPALLKERVCMAVEAEIQNEVMDYELMDEEYLEIVNRCWSKFYSRILQYHLNRSRPVGLLLFPSIDGIVLLKKSFFSVLRPMEPLEHLMLCNEQSTISHFRNTPILNEDPNICQDLIILMSTIVALDNQLSDDFKSTFEKELYQLKAPDKIIDNLMSKLSFQKNDSFLDFDFQLVFQQKLGNVKDLSSAITMLLAMLTYDIDQDSKSQHHSSRNKLLDHPFGSQLGISMTSEIIIQISLLRFSLCRNLLVLQKLALSRPETLDSETLHSIKSSLIPRTVVLVQAYYVTTWICESNPSVTPSQALLETSVQRLALLKLSNAKSVIGHRLSRSVSLLELYIQCGVKRTLHELDRNRDSSASVSSDLLSYVNTVTQLIWPISENFLFPEWLLSNGQFLILQEYVRLLSTWCERNNASRKFALAVSLLEMGEPQKACDYFLRAADGVLVDPYLSDLLLTSDVTTEKGALVLYFLKVIEIFEQHNAYDCIIELAMTAMTVTEKDDPILPTLHSIVFTQHLSLGHYTEAYNCLNTNPDAERKVDCLRQLVVTLFDQKNLLDLVNFPYVDMYQDLEKIMEARSRSVDLADNNYYDFLYSFHINKGNVRKAASIMYEQAIRLNQELPSIGVLARQVNCLLACMNALYLVNENYRWIVRPVVDRNMLNGCKDQDESRIMKDDEIRQHQVERITEVLEFEDIRREYQMAESKYKIATMQSDVNAVIHAGPEEMVAINANLGLYVDALNICESFNLHKTMVLQNLTSHCVRVSEKNQESWDWLVHNDVVDLEVSTLNPTNMCWKLLEKLTLTLEKEGETVLHKCVAENLFHHGAFLPEWLFSSYVEKNAAELLRLMMKMGRLEEAAQFSLEYIQKLLGKSKYDGRFKTRVETGEKNRDNYVPINAIENLLMELEAASADDRSYGELFKSVDYSLKEYIKNMQQVSHDVLETYKYK
ncbi:hypothetical protein TKK_0010980 [Trichogramma kaykai]|uniref:Nucleoporin Nup133/Nup155-like C-terminal domain-containing protein n=1 Tax=Trichogramma kaykai TaxID=54128 RepID=A0ABD2WUZ1_9HYME